ncbi:MAG: hypothetical protein P794_07670 [Epsilonproteobacteria bacterium (ex Lamellibrachia satsuma)]|nr:MAG: hypothetical protein P794_07670 [Epsilonproteobacteria bacterium (ex Lamellibrachia satsuma)]
MILKILVIVIFSVNLSFATSNGQELSGVNGTVLKKLSSAWDKSEYFINASPIEAVEHHRCTGIAPRLDHQYDSLVPTHYVPILTISDHHCKRVLSGFVGCEETIEQQSRSGQSVRVGGQYYTCGSWKERLILEDLRTGSVQVLTDVGERHEANSGAFYLPLAFTGDDRHIILKAYMGSPGAGGGSISYGYDLISGDPLMKEPRQYLSPASSRFYNNFAKVVYTENSDNLPSYTQPGPMSNNGRLVVKDLKLLKPILIMEEADTSYRILEIDEKNRTMTVRATHHSFSSKCPRAVDALYCSDKNVSLIKIPLPL